MHTPKNFYNYFKECYKLDYKEFIVENLLATKYPYKWFVSKKEELLNRTLPIIPYDNKKAVDLEKEIELYHLEKKLFYGCFFVLGKNSNPLIKDKRICAPLLLFPAQIKTLDEEKFLEINIEDVEVNRFVLTNLDSRDEQLSKDKFINEVYELIMSSQSDLISLKTIIEKYFANIDTEELLLNPQVWPVSKIRKYLAEGKLDEDSYSIVPAAGTVFIEKSESALKIVNDLNEISELNTFNTSLKELLEGVDKKFEFSHSIYRSRLNHDQFEALRNSYQYNNSVIIGPPGTGKTYTITSIVSDLVLNNQSVLVVSKTKQAVEVLRSMLEVDFSLKDYLIHTSGRNYRVSLKSKVRKYLSGILGNKNPMYNEAEIMGLYKRLEKDEERFEDLIEKVLEYSDLDFKTDLSLLEKWKKFYLDLVNINGDKLFQVFSSVNNLLKRIEFEIKTFAKRKILYNIRLNSSTYRKDLSLFYDALDTKSFTEYKNILNQVNHQSILKVFPIWLANLGDLNSVLPLQKDLFDVVIIDEATQCDIATALPAIFRAKRAVIVGDPNQLRHYSFVSKAHQLRLQSQYELPRTKIFDYRNRSILDLYISKVINQEQVSFLKEHFRSTPSLIEFSNQQFYEGQLKIIKSTPKHTSHNQIEIIEANGTRNEQGVNEKEAQVTLDKLESLFQEYEGKADPPSIGIISPFSSQVNYINRLLREKYDLDQLKRHQLLVGTPYHFQGSEREIIILSFGVCDQSHPSAFIHLNKPEVFNVAITRAKSFQFVIKSVSQSSLNQESYLYQYLRFIDNFSHVNEEHLIDDHFQKEVAGELAKHNYDQINLGYPVAGSLLDILVSHHGKNYFVDLIGYPGNYKEALSLERYKTLGRTGIQSMPLHYSYWLRNRKDAICRLIKFIQ